MFKTIFSTHQYLAKLYAFVFLIGLVFLGHGQTLSAGDIAKVQFNADGDEVMKFLALTDIPAFVKIII